jgi:hypothetical protein
MTHALQNSHCTKEILQFAPVSDTARPHTTAQNVLLALQGTDTPTAVQGTRLCSAGRQDSLSSCTMDSVRRGHPVRSTGVPLYTIILHLFSSRRFSQNCEKRLLASSVCLSLRLPVCLSVRLFVRLSLCLSAWNNSAPNGRIFMKI